MGDSEIIWDESYSVKIEKIDEQHKQLFAIITKLDKRLKSGVKKDEIQEILEELKDYTVFHFNAEEDMMESFRYPEINEHIKQHKTFIAKINEINLEDDIYFEGVKMISFLFDWLINHILEEDQKYTPYVVVN